MVAHSQGKGSKYVRKKGFKKLIAVNFCISKSEVCKREYFIKRLPRNEKLEWFRHN